MKHGREHFVTLETQEIKTVLEQSGRWGNTFMVPLTEPLQGNVEQDFMKDLYVLGAMLGDGSMRHDESKRSYTIRLTCHRDDGEIADRINNTLTIPLKPSPKKGRTHVVDWYASQRSNLRWELDDIGMFGRRSWEKDFPDSLLYAPLSDRWALMQGIMDTDGTVQRGRAAYYSTVSQALADKVTRLARSLGCFVTMQTAEPSYTWRGQKKHGRRAYRLRIKCATPERLFHIRRKREVAMALCYQSLSKKIIAIEDTGKRDTPVCITVSHPSGLYVTDDGTVTHNSSEAIASFFHHRKK